MKWGRRKARAAVGSIRSKIGSKSNSDPNYKNSPEHQAKVAKRKKAVKVGAAVVGTALAAYGTYKLAKMVQDKRSNAASAKAEAYLRDNFLERIGKTEFSDGRTNLTFATRTGSARFTTNGARNKAVGDLNAKTMAKARQIYNEGTSTKLDRGVSKIVNAGDAVKNAPGSAGRAAANAGRSAGRAAANAGRSAGRAAANAGRAVGNTARRAGEKATAPIRNKNEAIAREYGKISAQNKAKIWLGDEKLSSVTKYVNTPTKKGVTRIKVDHDAIINEHVDRARNDSLRTAVRNIYNYNYNKKRGRTPVIF